MRSIERREHPKFQHAGIQMLTIFPLMTPTAFVAESTFQVALFEKLCDHIIRLNG